MVGRTSHVESGSGRVDDDSMTVDVVGAASGGGSVGASEDGTGGSMVVEDVVDAGPVVTDEAAAVVSVGDVEATVRGSAGSPHAATTSIRPRRARGRFNDRQASPRPPPVNGPASWHVSGRCVFRPWSGPAANEPTDGRRRSRHPSRAGVRRSGWRRRRVMPELFSAVDAVDDPRVVATTERGRPMVDLFQRDAGLCDQFGVDAVATKSDV